MILGAVPFGTKAAVPERETTTASVGCAGAESETSSIVTRSLSMTGLVAVGEADWNSIVQSSSSWTMGLHRPLRQGVARVEDKYIVLQSKKVTVPHSDWFADNELFRGTAVEKIAQYRLDEFPPKIVSISIADSLTDLPSLIQLENTNFVLLLAVDGTKVDCSLVYSVAEKLLDQGMVYACVWGPDCEKVHDSIDQARFQRNSDETDGNVVITTWHDKVPISEAVWYFLYCAWPADDYVHTCSDWVAAVIGNPAWEAEVRAKVLAEKEESESP